MIVACTACSLVILALARVAAMASRRRMGVAQPFAVARRLGLRFAGYAVELDVRVARRGKGVCGRDGLIGLDALSACALVLGPQDVAVACDRSH